VHDDGVGAVREIGDVEERATAPLPFVISPGARLGWAALLLATTLAAILPPLRRANALRVREALAAT
jgi:ABC-type lipoprotein release transport system permease subunit